MSDIDTAVLSRGSGARANNMRAHNLSLLAQAVADAPVPLSRADLACATGLNRSTVTRLVEQLLGDGIVVEGDLRASTSGRPAVPLLPAPHTHVALGAEVSAEYLEVCVVDLTGRILVERRHAFTVDLPKRARMLAELAGIVNDLAVQVDRAGMSLVGVACGIPGLIDASTGYLHTSPHLGWRDVDLGSAVAEAGCSREMRFHNSAGVAAQAEVRARQRAGRAVDHFLYVTGSSGIGAALVRDRLVEAGARGWAGELGHVRVSGSEAACSCGATGCLETVAARAAILTDAGLPADAPIGQLLAALRRGDRQAEDAVALAGRALGEAIATYLNIVDTPVVVLGGLLERLFSRLGPRVRQGIGERVLSHAWAPVDLEPSITGAHAVSEGAAWLTLKDFLGSPDRWAPPPRGTTPYYSVDQTPEVTIE